MCFFAMNSAVAKNFGLAKILAKIQKIQKNQKIQKVFNSRHSEISQLKRNHETPATAPFDSCHSRLS